MNIYLSPVQSVLLGFVFVVLGFYYFKYMCFYFENKDKLNDVINTHEKKNNQKMSYREFRLYKHLNSPMMKEVNEMSRKFEEERQKEYEDYLKEGV